MKATLAMDPDYETLNRTKDLIGLYKILQKVNYSYTASEEPIVTMWKAKLDWARIRQQPGQTVSEYYDRFIALKEVNENLQTDLYVDLGFPNVIALERGVDFNAMSNDDRAEFSRNATIEGSERMEAIHFLHGANHEMFGDLIIDLKHSYLKNKWNEYPKNLQAAYTLLKGWTKGRPTRNPNKVGMSFNTLGDEDGEVMVNKGEKDPCMRCGRNNHSTKDCFAKRHADGTILYIEAEGSAMDDVSTLEIFGTIGDSHGLMFHIDSPTKHPSSMSSRGSIPNTWILLDSQSTIDVFSNEKLLTNIHATSTTMHIKCNAGSKSTNLRGTLSGYGEVWYFAEGIANILSLSRVKEKFRVTFDSAADNTFHVHKPGKILKF